MTTVISDNVSLPAGVPEPPTALQSEASPEIALRTPASRLCGGYADSISGIPTSAEFVGKIPIGFARHHRIMGLAATDGSLLLAMAGPESWHQLDVIGRFLGRFAPPLFAPAAAISAAINAAYQQRTGQAQEMIQNLDGGSLAEEVQRLAAREDLLDVGGRAPVIKLVNLLLLEAVKCGASDIHV